MAKTGNHGRIVPHDAAANLIAMHAISQGSGVILFAATFESVLASTLRIAHAAGRIEGLMSAQAHVQDTMRRVG